MPSPSPTDTFSDALNLIGPVKKRAPALTAVEEVQARTQAERAIQPTAEQLMLEQGREPGRETEVRAEQRTRGQAFEREQEAKFIAENREPGVELDVVSGGPAGQRAKMSFERDTQKRMEWLTQQPGIEAARPTKSGNGIIVRVKTEDGGSRDVLFDERNVTMKDFADMTGDLPGIAVSALAAYLTGGMSLIPQATVTAGAGAAAGAIQDVAVRAGSGREIDPGEIAVARGAQGAVETVIPLAPAAGKRLAQAVIGPFSKTAGPLEAAAKAAARRQGVPMTASQLTGNKAVARVEQFTKELPFGTPLVEQAKAQDDAINRVREFLIGPEGTLPTAQEISERTGAALAEAKEGAQASVANRARQTERQTQESVERLLEQNLPGGPITPSEAGAAVRKAVTAQRDQFKEAATMAYNRVYSMPGADAEFVPSTPIKNLVKDIQEKSTEATQQLLPEIKRIFKVGDTIPDKMTLRQAVELRSVIGDMVGRPEALAGIPTGYLKRLYGAATEAIEQGVKAAPNPEIGKALSDAQTFYKENFWKFEQPGVADLFAEVAPGKGFKVGDSEVGRRLTAGAGDVDQLKVMREMLGKDSAEYKGLLRSSVNEMIQQSSFGEKFINAGEFLGRLKALSPEFRKEAIGSIEKELVGDAKVLELLQGKKVEPLEMERILNSRPGKVASTVRDIIEEQAAVDKAYNSALMRQLTDGRFSPATFNADEFMSRFVDNSSAQDLRQVMTQLRVADPELPNLIKRRATADLLEKAAGEIKPDAAVAGEIGNFDFNKLRSFLTGPTGEKYKTMLGKDVIDTLEDLTTIEAARAKSAGMAKASGQLVYSNILAALMDFRFSEVPRIAKNRVLAGMLTTPGLKAWLTSTAKIPATPKTRAMVMASPPVIRSILEEFKDEPDLLGEVLDGIKMSPDNQPEPTPSARDLIDAR
jgi:hypothetical protein